MITHKITLSPDPIKGRGHYLARITTNSEPQKELNNINVTYIIDISGSMKHQLKYLKEALKESISALRPDDTFNVIAFNHDIHPIIKNKKIIKEGDLSDVFSKIDILIADGGTNLKKAIAEATSNTALLLTDGNDCDKTVSADQLLQIRKEAIGQKKGIQQNIQDEIAQYSLFAIGLGKQYNRFLLRNLAIEGGTSFPYHISCSNDIKEVFKDLQPELRDRTRAINLEVDVNQMLHQFKIGTLTYGSSASNVIPISISPEQQKITIQLKDNISNKTETISILLEKNMPVDGSILALYASIQASAICADNTSYEHALKKMQEQVLPYALASVDQTTIKLINDSMNNLGEENARRTSSYVTAKSCRTTFIPAFSNTRPKQTTICSDDAKQFLIADPNTNIIQVFAQFIKNETKGFISPVKEEQLAYVTNFNSPRLREPCKAFCNTLDPKMSLFDVLVNLQKHTSELPNGTINDPMHQKLINKAFTVTHEEITYPCTSIGPFVESKTTTPLIKLLALTYNIGRAIADDKFPPHGLRKQSELYLYPSWLTCKANTKPQELYLINNNKVYNLNNADDVKEVIAEYQSSVSNSLLEECLQRFNISIPNTALQTSITFSPSGMFFAGVSNADSIITSENGTLPNIQ